MNSADYTFFIAIFGLLVLFVAGLFLGLALGRRNGRLEAERELPDRLASERDDAVKRSRAVVGGQVAEQLAPYLPDFPCDPGDARFIGKPIDFVCFSGAGGAASATSAGGSVEEIIFVEVKSGGSGLSRTEKSVRDAVVAGRVRWVEYRIPLD
ncbi:MAG: Holliday junction resolvase [Spirochaetae bacterium HGW-Spirochaetae-9]|nr:MAG: Holliday junction resolvase [Spirochaetae bacterium HGW-Spirochaetae-9]